MGAREDLLAIPDDVLRGGDVMAAILVHMEFRDNPKRWWNGFGDLTLNGQKWQGVGDLISISPIASSYQLSATQVTFHLAASPEMLSTALNSKDLVRGRPVTIYMQLFAQENLSIAGHSQNGGEIKSGSPIGSPFALYTGIMQKMPWSMAGPFERSIKIEADGLFYRRNAASRALWTDSDQKARYPGDRGFERLPIYANGYETKWRG